MMKLDTPVGDPIGLTLTTPRNVVDDVHVVLLSGCKDSQESADVSDTTEFGLPKSADPGGAGGACTNALLMTVHDDTPDDTWLSTLVTMRQWLEKNARTRSARACRAPTRRSASASPSPCSTPGARTSPRASDARARCSSGSTTWGRTRRWTAPGTTSTRCSVRRGGGYKDDALSMRVLRDNGTDVSPTKANIEKALRWLVKGAGPGRLAAPALQRPRRLSEGRRRAFVDDHGGDVALVPVDYVENGVVKDDDLFRTLVAPLAPGASLVAVMDCCHSGTMLDRGYDFTLTDKQFAHVPNAYLRRCR